MDMDLDHNTTLEENDEINNLTLELLTSKTKFNKLMFKINPSKFKERNEYYENINREKTKIDSIFQQLLNHPEETISKDLNASFDCFVKNCIKHLDLETMDNNDNNDNDDDDDDDDDDDNDEQQDTMFDNCIGTLDIWGKKIEKKDYSYLD